MSCHNSQLKQGGLSLETHADALAGGNSGEVLVPGNPDGSYLLNLISPSQGQAEMPKDAAPLSAEEVASIRKWIEQGAKWPKEFRLEPPAVSDLNWWSLEPIKQPPLPAVSSERQLWTRTPIDIFIAAKHQEKQLTPAAEADRRTLIRRVTYDLTGLPPTPKAVADFLADPAPDAYENLVDRLLASPQHGEHWARHWLDVVHYADTHGYDKDKPRPNAWPYRDYVIRAFNQDKPYRRFVQEQIAGDVLWPETRDGIAATGFLAAGPWDFIGHVEVPESKIDGKIARHLDRDDMVTTTMNTFASLTAQCARCHNHKFDPIRMEDYYRLQAVFAAIDRADRPLPLTGELAQRKTSLQQELDQVANELKQLDEQIHQTAGPKLKEIEQQFEQSLQGEPLPARPEFGYHSAISPKALETKWVQIDFGEAKELRFIVLVACHDNFNNIGAGFGFPQRYKIELSNDPTFQTKTFLALDQTTTDTINPGVSPVCFSVESAEKFRYLRITATKLALRQNDYIFALGEVFAFDVLGQNVALGQAVTALDSIEAPVRWRRQNLVDGSFYGQRSDTNLAKLAELQSARQRLLKKAITPEMETHRQALEQQRQATEQQLAALPAAEMVYAAATTFPKQGQFTATGGKPREVHLLARGDVTKPGQLLEAGTVPLFPESPSRFDLPADHSEGQRRAALAQWLVHRDNPLTWRSIVNRVWQHHFGRGLVDSANDFGRGGQLPTHPELLDWLAADFRDNGQSLKRLHRQICLSATYRQSSASQPAFAEADANNEWLWRMNRRRLTAEEIRDVALLVSGRLRTGMGGPGFQDFAIEKPQHSPHYEYDQATPSDPATHRRAIYRFIVRSQPQPMMTVFDCADPAISVPKREETLTPLQSLSLMNNPFMVWAAGEFAIHLQQLSSDRDAQLQQGFLLLLNREPTAAELRAFNEFAKKFGLPAACRVMLNLNEFLFVD